MSKMNCWEFRNCGREPNGSKVKEFGVCPAAKPSEFKNINNGEHSGRFCWALDGTFCDDSINGSFSQKLMSCIECPFLQYVQDQESSSFTLTPKDACEQQKQLTEKAKETKAIAQY